MIFHWLKRQKILITVLLVLTAFVTMGLLERGVRDPYNRTVGPQRLLAVALIKANIANMSVCVCSPDREVRLHGPYGLTTIASIYGEEGSERRPGIVLIHGNTALGRNLSTYRVMATKLAKNGFIVLTLDLPGFGESDDPFATRIPEALDETKMVATAIEYLIANTNVDKENLSVIGHSRGRAAALKIGISMGEIKNIILMGLMDVPGVGDHIEVPDRRSEETHQFVYGHPIPKWVTPDIWRNHMVLADLVAYMPYFTRDGHKLLILVIGEHENQQTVDMIMGKGPSKSTVEAYDHLERTFAALAEPKTRITLKGSDHYLNTAQSLGVIFYDRTVVDQFVHEVTTRIRAERRRDARSASQRLHPLPPTVTTGFAPPQK
jgi:pimeloyl-ACP methyl ester carboxylesterase